MKSKSKWNFLLISVTCLLSYLYQSASTDTLIFLDKFIPEQLIVNILNNSLKILITLIIIYILGYIIVYKREQDITIKKVCDNICKSVFLLIERTEGHEYMQNVRVSIYRANAPNSPRQILKMYARYQTRTPIKKSKIKYRPGIGCVGLCFETQTNISISIPEYSRNKKKYIRACMQKFHMSENENNKLNIKSSSFIGIPICCFNSGHSWGVLVVDSTKNAKNMEPLTRDIEHIINSCKVFFEEGGVL